MNFTQLDGEQFHETWERLNELMRKCPHHEVPCWHLVDTFYNNLIEKHSTMIDESCDGTFMRKNVDEGWQLFEQFAENSRHHQDSRTSDDMYTPAQNKPRDMYYVDRQDGLSSKVDSLDKNVMPRIFKPYFFF